MADQGRPIRPSPLRFAPVEVFVRLAIGKRHVFVIGGSLLLAVAVAMIVFAVAHSTDSASASNPQHVEMSLTVPAGQTVACPPNKQPKTPGTPLLLVPYDGKIDLEINDDVIPDNGYQLVDAWVNYGDQLGDQANNGAVKNSIATVVVWPDLDPVTFNFFHSDEAGDGRLDSVLLGGLTGQNTALSPLVPSFYVGTVYTISLTCTSGPSNTAVFLVLEGDAPASTSGALYTEFGTNTQFRPALTNIDINCVDEPTPTPPPPTATPAPIPRMSKCNQADNAEEGVKDFPDCASLVNVFLTRQGAKIPPSACMTTKGTSANVAELAEKLSQPIVSADPKNPSSFQQLAAFEFEVHYDSTKVCVDINEGPDWAAAGAICIIQDDQPDSKPQLEGVARIGCVTIGKGHGIDDLAVIATVDIYPQPEIYSQAKPNQNNGVVVQINNVGCDLGDEQGQAIPIFSCDDADITFRYLEGDVIPDCVIDAVDAQAIAFRWGAAKGSLVYTDFMNLEPSGTQADNDIDINDLQFVFGRFGSTCKAPHPDQDPVNPKA